MVVVAGGVALEEVDPRTMRSLRVPGLYLCGEVLDIAGPIVFLCSDLARHITGEILNVNGGSVLCG